MIEGRIRKPLARFAARLAASALQSRRKLNFNNMTNPPKKKTTGRKPKPEEEKAGAPILVRATLAERKAIRKRADAAELSLSRFLVARGLSDQPPPTKEDKEALSRILFELKKAGNNLNQIAHAMHSSRLTGAPPPANGETSQALLTIREASTAVKKRMK
jgi:hypothetical protein